MKIAVTSTGKTLDSQVDPRFGRAACFVIIDTDTSDLTIIENENVAAIGGAGTAAAKLVIDAGARAVLTGNCGPKAQSTLSATGVKLYTGATGTVAETVERFKSGGLSETARPNGQAHFGVDG
jgi:predicted Fe-Mo cluster-binding NifX family protein